ncbi:sialic acid-binding Ig-like lectin 14 [Phyllobates terribilis]|uniref:sialic acid-binding Ig-like lectin 14 n=1 Tax=Phyllobates terribilis TaxID=111132 RepID=UPI003CCA9501
MARKGITCHAAGYSIRVPPDVGVQEGLCVTIPCTFTADYRNTFSNSTGYWIQIRKKEPLSPYYIVATNNKSSDVNKTNFHLTGNLDNGDCTLTITGAKKEDEGRYYFRFEETKDSKVDARKEDQVTDIFSFLESKKSKVKYNYNRDATTINVTDLTEEPVISDLGTLITGVNKTLTCYPPRNCSATSLHFQWKKSNVADVWKKNSSTVTFTPSIKDHHENITCEMTNSRGRTTRKTVLLDVCCPTCIAITGEIIEKGRNKPDNAIRAEEGSSVILKCSVDSSLFLNVTWTDKKNEVLQHGTEKELELRLDNITMEHTGVYTCSIMTVNVIKSTNISLIVQYSTHITMNSTIIIGMVISNIVVLILIFVGINFFMKRKMEKRQLAMRSPDPGTQGTECTYQELKGQKNDVYHNFKMQ